MDIVGENSTKMLWSKLVLG